MIEDRIRDALGERPQGISPVASGVGGRVERAAFSCGRTLIVKTRTDPNHQPLDIEARMLALLAARSSLPVPRVYFSHPDMIIMQDMAADVAIDPGPGVEVHAARLLAALHGVMSPDGRFGLEHDGAIGPLPQPNTPNESWAEFFMTRRILHMLSLARGTLSAKCASRVERMASNVDQLVPVSPAPSLIHGDVWSGNVIASAGRVVAFIDPAPSYAHAEMELAFIALFGTFGEAFFAGYHRLRPIDPEFWRTRRAVYQVYPLLVHVRLFGGGYTAQLEQTLETIGF
jgi:fructosamine-3-kinase